MKRHNHQHTVRVAGSVAAVAAAVILLSVSGFAQEQAPAGTELPAVQSAREAARRSACSNSFKQPVPCTSQLQQSDPAQTAAAQGANGSTQMLFEPLANLHVVETEAVEFDYYTFGYLPGTPRIEGRRTTTSYGLNPGNPMPGALGICRHFVAATRQAGGEVLYDNDRNIVVLRFNQQGLETWAEIACDKDRYRVNIIEREGGGQNEDGMAPNASDQFTKKHISQPNWADVSMGGANAGKQTQGTKPPPLALSHGGDEPPLEEATFAKKANAPGGDHLKTTTFSTEIEGATVRQGNSGQGAAPPAPGKTVASNAPAAANPGGNRAVNSGVAAPSPAAPATAQAAADAPLPVEDEKIDFVPGEKQIFFDDFTDTPRGSPPVHWRVRGSSVTMRAKGDAKQLTVTKGDTTLLANLKGLPKNFTIESEIDFNGQQSNAQVRLFLVALPPERQLARVLVWARGGGQGEGGVQLHVAGAEVGNADFKFDLTKPLLLNLWMQDGRLRAYVNNERLIDVNQIELPKVDGAFLDFQLQDTPISLGKFRVAASAPDFSQTILSSGRYVTHGIHFDYDSDQLKPDSVSVLRMIADAMSDGPALKLRIEGHTDSTGDAQHNLELSQRRAESVKRALVSQFKISADHLTAAGLGASKPIDDNSKPEGRANNRRVEFVKQ